MTTESNIALADKVLAEKAKPSRAERGEVRGSGIIIGRRDRKGRLTVVPFPFEHGTREGAVAEATRLSHQHPGATFVVLVAVETVLNDKVE